MNEPGRPRLGVPRDTLPKTWRVTEMNDRHHEIARLLLLGMSGHDIAKQLKISPQCVTLVKNSPPVQEQLTMLRIQRDSETVDIAIQIQKTLPEAVRILEEQLADNSGGISPSLKSKNAFGLLSIGGHGPSKKLSVRGAYAVLTADDIKQITDRGRDIKDEIDTVDVTPEEATG